MKNVWLALGLGTLTACWPDIRGVDYEPWDEQAAAEAPKVVNEPGPDGTTLTTVDATDALAWVYVELDEDMLELAGDVEGWDIAFSRQRIMLNGGISGEGGVEVAVIEAESLADVVTAPVTGFATDLEDDDDDNAEPEYAFDVWFDYNSSNHVLTPFPLVFVVRTTDDQLVAIEILSYYDDAGTSAVFALTWKYL
jgi:hypothetical protein